MFAHHIATARRRRRLALLCMAAVAGTLALGANADPAHAAVVRKVALADLTEAHLAAGDQQNIDAARDD